MWDEDEIEKYKKADGSVDWGKYAIAQLSNNDLSKTNNKKTAKLEELSIFKIADEMSDKVWKIVYKWDFFAKKTVGDQWVRSADSIAANISEGYGRYYFGEYILFLYYARGSLYETKFWLEKAYKRSLIKNDAYKELKGMCESLPIEINKVVKIVKGERYKWKGKPRY